MSNHHHPAIMAALEACQKGNNSSYQMCMDEWFVLLMFFVSKIIRFSFKSFEALETQCKPCCFMQSLTHTCRLDGAFMHNPKGDGITCWERREFQQLFGMFSNASTVDQVVEHLGQVRNL
jgi:hypothetical protein